MAEGSSFVRVPPQSTGKRVATEERTQVAFDNQTVAFSVGNTVNGQTSNAQGIITAIVTEGFATNEGLLWLSSVTGTFVDNENLQVSAVTHAVVNTTTYAAEAYDYAQNVIVDPDNPTHRQKIDRFGATLNTFADGTPTFGAFGALSVGEAQTVKDYRFAYDGKNSHFYDNTSGTGVVTHEANPGGMLLSVGVPDGDIAQRTSNFYHPYAPGVGQLIEMSIRHGDVGKLNNRRRWGYFDDNNGAYFELDGTTLYTVIRSNVSGSVVETRIVQANWSDDALDGTDSIGFNLDLTAPNIYFIDLQWLGAGRVRFGIIEPGGFRIVANVVEHANMAGDFPYMRTATLPVRIENENTGLSASTSELRLVCAVVKHTSAVAITGDRMSYASGTGLTTITQSSGEVPLVSLRPKITFNSIENHALIKIIAINLANITNTGGSPVIFRFRQSADDSALTAESFVSHTANSIAEIDTSATAIAGTSPVLGEFIVTADDVRYIQIPDSRDIHILELFLNADGSTQPIFTITAECLSGTNADVFFNVNAEEIKT